MLQKETIYLPPSEKYVFLTFTDFVPLEYIYFHYLPGMYTLWEVVLYVSH